MTKIEALRMEVATAIGAGVVSAAAAMVGDWLIAGFGLIYIAVIRFYMYLAIRKLERHDNESETANNNS